MDKAKKTADKLDITNIHVGNVLTDDVFYCDDETANAKWAKMGILAIEMETAALYMTAARYKANALSILTVSDHIIKNQQTTTKERETAFTSMMNIALKMA